MKESRFICPQFGEDPASRASPEGLQGGGGCTDSYRGPRGQNSSVRSLVPRDLATPMVVFFFFVATKDARRLWFGESGFRVIANAGGSSDGHQRTREKKIRNWN